MSAPSADGNGNALRAFVREWAAEYGSDPEAAREALTELDHLDELIMDDPDRWSK